MNKTDFGNIVRAYQAAMESMLEANRLEPGKGSIESLKEIGVDLALHLPSFISGLVKQTQATVPKSVKEVASLGSGYRPQQGSPYAVIVDAGLLLAALSGRLPEEKSPAVAALVDKARARMRQDGIYLMIEGADLQSIPHEYNKLS